jgi:hypothetical protein
MQRLPTRATAALAVALVLLALCPAAAAAADGGGDEEAEETKKVMITPQEFCDGCMMAMEEFHRTVDGNAAKKKFNADGAIDGYATAQATCDGEAFGAGIKKNLQYGCMRTFDKHRLEQALGGMGGLLMMGQKTFVLEKKREVCVEKLGACDAKALVDPYAPFEGSENACEACRAVVRDIETLMAREEKITRKRLAPMMERVCADLVYRHARPVFLEAVCEELMDEFEPSIISIISMRAQLTANYASLGSIKLSETLDEKVCGELAKMCPLPKKEL